MNKKILIIAAHPDDEILGAGGVIIKHIKNNDEVYCLILGEGEKSRVQESSEEKIFELHNQARNAAKIIGFKEIYFENLPDNEFDSISLLKITKKVERYINKIQPDIVYTHYENDLNIDHCLTFQAVITACRPCNNNCPKEIYCFEVLSSTEWQLQGEKFKPNVYINIENEIEGKIQALQAYASELRNYPHPRSEEGIKILAKYRGLECGKKCVEAFYLVRSIN